MKRFPIVLVGLALAIAPKAVIAQNQPRADVPFKVANTIQLRQPVEDLKAGIPPMLTRELIRQSLLMAGRDDLGLYTRDEVLGETAGKGFAAIDSRTIGMTVTMSARGGGTQLGIEFAAPNGKKTLLSIPMPMFPDVPQGTPPIPDVAWLSVLAEKFSRKEFSDCLKAAGFTGAAKPMLSTTEVPADLETRLTELTAFGQYDAVRRAHAAIAKDGHSPAMLEVLARGYANLGQLTRFLWTADADVFMARSLLYAQRMVVLNNTPRAHWVRAYALALAGLHAAALGELSAIQGNHAPPPWVDPIEPLCSYDTDKLNDLGGTIDRRYAPLTRFMAFLTVENSGCRTVVVQQGKSVLEADPFCDRVVDALCDSAGVSFLHTLTESSFDLTVALFRRELPRIADLPRAVQDTWQRAHTDPNLNADIADVSQAFSDATEDAEPSWPALGHMLKEGNFAHVYRRVFFEAFEWSVDPAHTIQEKAPLVAGHRYQPLISGMLNRFHGQFQQPTALADMRFADPMFRFPIAQSVDIATDLRDKLDALWQMQVAHHDLTAWDLERAALTGSPHAYDGAQAPMHMRWLRLISPYSPVAAAKMLREGYINMPEEQFMIEMGKLFGKQPAYATVVADHYMYVMPRHYDNAIAVLKELIPRTRAVEDYRRLADCYAAVNDEDHWLSTLDDSLQLEDFALDHAFTQSMIANHLMSQMKYTQALPYADASASSGAAWAMRCAARCHTGMGDWAAAERLLIEEAHRYSEPELAHYMWCRETGHGDLDGARAQTRAVLMTGPLNRDQAIFYHGEGDADNERRVLKALVDETHDEFCCAWLAMLEDKAGDKAAGDALLLAQAQHLPKPPNPDQGTVALTDFEGWLLKEREIVKTTRTGVILHKTPVAQFMKSMEKYDVSVQSQIQFFMGEYQLSHGGDVQQAMDMLKFCALHSEIASSTGFMARLELIQRHVDPFNPPPPASTLPSAAATKAAPQ